MVNLQEKAQDLKLGVYLHVPFCARQCDFCNFYQRPPQRGEVQEFLAGIRAEMEALPPPRPVETVFWGGGTPGLLSTADLARLADDMLHHLPAPPQEWTVEMAPATVKADKIRMLVDRGVTRFSMGVQSFQEDLLERLGRVHARSQVFRAYDVLRDAGAGNVNLDLIFAIPGQSLEQARRDLDEAVWLQPEHLSTYCLTFEEDTALWLRLRQGDLNPPDPLAEAGFYEQTWDVLGAAGFPQYEVSNFARPGFACQHNLNTWAMQEWIGYGPSASSQFGMRRWTNPHSLSEWLEGLRSGGMRFADETTLNLDMLAADVLIFGLRCNGGVDLAAWRRRFGADRLQLFQPFLDRLMEDGLLQMAASERGHCLRPSPSCPRNLIQLTRRGRLVADRIGLELLECGIRQVEGSIPEFF